MLDVYCCKNIFGFKGVLLHLKFEYMRYWLHADDEDDKDDNEEEKEGGVEVKKEAEESTSGVTKRETRATRDQQKVNSMVVWILFIIWYFTI